MLSLITPIRWWLLEWTFKSTLWSGFACNRHQVWWPARGVRVSGGVGGVQPEACQGVICTCWLLTMSGEKIIRELQWENEQIKLLICSNWYNQMDEKSWLANYQVTKKNVCFIVKWYMSKDMARYLLRNGSLMSIEVEPKLVDVFSYQNLKGEYIYATLSDRTEYLLLKAWQASWPLVHWGLCKGGSVKRTSTWWTCFLKLIFLISSWLVIFCVMENILISNRLQTI